MEGAVLEQERPIQKDPEEMIKIRDEYRRLFYPKMIEEAHADALPKNIRDLREGLDSKVHELADRGEPHEQLDAEGKKIIPEFVLRKEDNWESIGWRESDKREVKNRLRSLLRLDENAITHALESIVATGMTPDQALRRLSEDAYQNQRRAFEEQVGGHRGDFTEEDMQLTTHALFLEDVLNDLGDIKTDYIRRFILNKELNNKTLVIKGYNQHTLQEEYDNKLPNNLFDLAWNIGFERKSQFGINGQFPVLQMQVEKYKTKDESGNEVEKVKGRYVVNQANWMRWMRDQINWWYEQYDTDEVTDYFSKVEIKKGPYYNVNLVTMLFNYNRYFRDEKGHLWQRLYDQTLLEPWMMMNLRQYHLEYEKVMSDEGKLSDAYNNLFFLSKLTRKVYGKSMVNILMTLPEDFNGKDSDAKLGEAWTKMFQVYYHMADFERLEDILGEDSPLFQRDTWLKAMLEVGEGIIDQTGMPVLGTFLGTREKDFDAAFNPNTGKVRDENAFIKFLNVFPTPSSQSTAVKVINQVLKDIVAEKTYSKEFNANSSDIKQNDYDIEGKVKDNISLDYAWLLAHSWTFFSGAAAKNNFPGVSGHLAETKWQLTGMYREKYMGYGGGGNPYTVYMFPQLSRPFLEAIHVENAFEDYSYYDDHHKEMIHKSRNKTPMEIIMELNLVRVKNEEKRKTLQGQLQGAITRGSEAEKQRLLKELSHLDDLEKNEYKIVAGNLEFNEHAMRYFAQNVIGRAKVVYETLMGAQEIDFEHFTKYDNVFRGVSFNRGEWQKALQGGLITPLRYLFMANGSTNYNMKVRTPVFLGHDGKKNVWEYRDVPLGEAMFGHQVLDIHEFRSTIHDFTPEQWKEMKKRGYRKRGHNIIRPDGRHDINYNKVNDNQALAYKQWMLMKLAGDLWSHIDRHSTDPAYNMEHYLSIIEAIELLPGDIEGNEDSVKKTRVPKPFFSHHQMQWLRRISGTTNTALFTRQFFSDIFVGDKKKKESMFGESTSIILAAIFKGY